MGIHKTTKEESMKKLVILGAATAMIFAGVLSAQANMKNLSMYKKAFEGARPKCSTCHTTPMPKKDKADLNAYGEAVKAHAHEATPEAEITVETYQEVGTVEDFEAHMEEMKGSHDEMKGSH